jgi:hypothetical protein
MKKLLILTAILMLTLLPILAGCQASGTTAPGSNQTTGTQAQSTGTQPSSSGNETGFLKIAYIAVSKPDAQGNVSFKASFTNGMPKAIKDISFDVEAYDTAGQPAKDSVTGASLRRCKYTGAIETNQTVDGAIWTTVWQNPAITTVKLQEIFITFADGSNVIFTEDAIQKMTFDTTTF